jgi:hypothetical protein
MRTIFFTNNIIILRTQLHHQSFDEVVKLLSINNLEYLVEIEAETHVKDLEAYAIVEENPLKSKDLKESS